MRQAENYVPGFAAPRGTKGGEPATARSFLEA
jgi:hypothetical protein